MLRAWRGQTLGATHLAVVIKAGNPLVRVDPYALSYAITDNTDPDNPVELVEPTDALANRTEVGEYYATWTVPADATYGSYFLTWRWQISADSSEQRADVEFLVEELRLISLADLYVTPEDVWTTIGGNARAKYDRDYITLRIQAVQQYVERITGWFFNVRRMVVKLDGTGTELLVLPLPLVGQPDEIAYLGANNTYEPVAVSNFQIYNRYQPDDRMYPRIKVAMAERQNLFQRVTLSDVFPKGHQNIRITGRWGFVERDGTTPAPILQCMMMLIMDILHPFGSAAERRRLRTRRVNEETSSNHRYQLQRVITDLDLSGNPEVDQILAKYIRPPEVDSA